MPTNLTLELLPVPDSKLVEAHRSFVKEMTSHILNVAFRWQVLEGNDDNSIPFAEIEGNANISKILAQGGEVFRLCGTTFSAVNQVGAFVNTERNSAGWLTLKATLPHSWDNQPETKTAATIALRNAFGRYLKSKILDSVDPAITDFYARRESTLVQLEALNAKIIVENDQLRRSLEERSVLQQTRLEESYRDRLNALESDFRLKADGLTATENALLEQKKLLDDRNNTHARRQIHQDLKKVLKERNTDFSLTPKTVRKRLPASIALIGLICLLAVVSRMGAVRDNAVSRSRATVLVFSATLHVVVKRFCKFGGVLHSLAGPLV